MRGDYATRFQALIDEQEKQKGDHLDSECPRKACADERKPDRQKYRVADNKQVERARGLAG